MKKYSVLAGLLLASLPAFGNGPVSAAPPVATVSTARVRLPGQMSPGALRGTSFLGRKDSTETVPLALTLPLRDPAGLDRLLDRLYTPGSPQFHQFITPAEFADRFSPTPQAYTAVERYALASGLTITGTHADRLLLEVSGPTAAVESAFRVHLQNYAALDGRVFHAPDTEPTIPAALAGRIVGVVGLQNMTQLHPHLRRLETSFLPNQIGTDPNDGGLTPSNIKAAYNLTQTPLTGAGRTLGLMELDSYTPSDITHYEDAFGLPHVPLVDILTDGAVDVPSQTDGPSEVTLDIELMTALAPGASAIRVYEAPLSEVGLLAAFTTIADENIAKEVSTSWGQPETDANSAGGIGNQENIIFKQMAAQGQSLYAAAGDSGAYDDGQTTSVDDPSSQPFVTGVGGTKLRVAAPGGGYGSESTWGDPSDTRRSPFGAGGGGGVSAVWTIPIYQNGVAGLYSTTQRNVPDVSLDADPNTGYSIYFSDPVDGSKFYVYGGTSCAAPLWAAFTALVNQQRTINVEPDLGFPNTAIYGVAGGTDYATGFHDIADGSNNLFYAAGPGYDNATGWGSFNGANLITLLAPTVVVGVNPISALTVSPTSVVGGLTAQGVVTLTNPAPAAGESVSLTVTSGPASVPTSVAVAPGASSADFNIATVPVTGATTVTITATLGGGPVSAVLTVTPAPIVITPISLTLTPASVGGGGSSFGIVSVSGPVPTGGLTVTLASADPSVTVPATVFVPTGAISAQFPVTTTPVNATVAVTLSATLNSVTQSATLTVEAPALELITLSPVSVIGGQNASAILNLTLPAPTGGAQITLTSSDPTAVIPASVTIPAGQTSVTVPITTSVVTTALPVTITAAYAGVTQKATLTVSPVLATGLTLTPPGVIGGVTSVGIITLNAPVPAGGLTATLSSSDPAAPVPATLAIPQGATSASFQVPTTPVPAVVVAHITVTLNGASQSGTLTIQPIQIIALSVNPASVVTGSPITGSLTLNAPAPAGGVVVTLSSSTPAATVPATLLIPAGVSVMTFPVATPHVGGAVISALLAGAPQTVSLTVIAAAGTSFPAGLNMISAPYDYAGVPLDGLFGYTGVVLATWQTATGAYALSPAAPADALHLGRGYWVNLPAAETLTSVGAPADPTHDFTIALLPGWNQIGDPFTTPTTVSRLSLTAGGAPIQFDQASTAAPLVVSALVYRYAPKQGTTPGGYLWVRDTDAIQPGLGYWIYAYEAATLTIPHP